VVLETCCILQSRI